MTDSRADTILQALRQVPYPGYEHDIVTLGIVEDIAPQERGGFVITLRQATENDTLMRELAATVEARLSRQRGLAPIALRVRRMEAELGEKTGRMRLAGVRHVIAIASGKGGVGKSTVAANLSLALAARGLAVGLLDADIYGPSMGLMFDAMAERPRSAGPERFYPVERHGIKLISMAFFLTERAPVIWRGPMVMSAVRQFLQQTSWGELDYLIVDLPPGTGDAQLTLAQLVALDGAVIVTTPQDLALLDAMRAVRMFHQVHCPILGVIENMSGFVCPQCGESEPIFGSGGGARMAAQEGVPLLGTLPLDLSVGETGDRGTPLVLDQPDHALSRGFAQIARQLIETLP
ncbi:MAG TPA: Mrp/NBP35 family ATP-binding protein [Candidatus Binataceae bacterium]|nr:Mrp/NBP35 family ATP-binding protein [Candidatus Binataceae bacterium]